VDKVEGKGLSTNDLTDTLLAKLNTISEGATNVTKVSQLENDSDYQTGTEVNAAIQAVVGAAPEALDTLKELADALDNDADFASTITNKITEVNTALTTEVTRAKAAEDTIEASVGLNEDGSHKTTTGNYTSGATTIAEEIAVLDAQAKTNADAVSAEATRAKAAESTNATAISDEITRAKAAEQANADSIAALQSSVSAFTAITDEEINDICK